MVESSPLLSGGGARRASNAHRALKLLILTSLAAAVLVLLAVSKLGQQTELIQWIVPKAVIEKSDVPVNHKMRYIYVKSADLKYDKKKNMQVFNGHEAHRSELSPLQARIKAQSLVALEPNQTVAPKGSVRSCAISSLQMQATLVLHGWGICGYMLHPVSETSQHPTMGFITNVTDGPDASISGPPNNTYCTPDRMDKPPCNTEWVRTLARNDPSSFKACLGKIKGVSQTCDTFDRCGPRTHVPPPPGSQNSFMSSAPTGATKGVCDTPDMSYYKEHEILAMCGICDMFRATMSNTYKSPRAGFIETAKPSAAGALKATGYVQLAGLSFATLAALIAARTALA